MVHEIPVPSTLGPHDLLLKVAAASLCHTDSMVSANLMAGTKLPITASHEGCGTVVAIGSEVKDFKVGHRVLAGTPRNRCGKCDDCRSPNEQYCVNRSGGIGLQVDGAFAEYLVADSRSAALLPDSLDFVSAAPLACAGITAWGALQHANLLQGQWIGIVGSGGGVGHLAIEFARAQGLQVVGIDAQDKGLKLSQDAGADIVLDARDGADSVVQKVQEVTSGIGVAATINLSDAPSAAGLACSITARHGNMIQVAQVRINISAFYWKYTNLSLPQPKDICIPYREIIFRNIHVSGSLTGSREQMKDMLKFVAEHHIPVKTNNYYGLKEIPKLLEDSHRGKLQGKGVVVVDSTQI